MKAHWIAIGATAAAMLAPGVIFVMRAPVGDATEAAYQSVSPGEARALGARWRADPTPALASQYANALLAAGLNDDLLAEIERGGLFSGEKGKSSLYEAEAYLRLGRYDRAVAAAGAASGPYGAYARARSAYSMMSDAAAIEADLHTALRGPEPLAAQAYLFRARIALDANDTQTARAAARRASEVGAALALVERIEIEADIRDGDGAAAARKLEQRGRMERGDVETARLVTLIELRSADARRAARAVDRTADQARPLAAFAKWRAGDKAQAAALIETQLGAAPDDWVSLDLGAAIAADFGQAELSAARRARLLTLRPGVGALRAMRAGDDRDGIFSALGAIEDPTPSGALAFLVGKDVASPTQALVEANAGEKAIIALAAALHAGDEQRLRAGVAAPALPDDPLAMALLGQAFMRLGDMAKAEAKLQEAAKAAPDFYAPVALLADLYDSAGKQAAAADALDDFVRSAPTHGAARLALAMARYALGDAPAAADAFALAPQAQLFADPSTARAYGASARSVGGARLEAMTDAARGYAPTPALLAVALEAAGDDNAAAAAYRRAVLADPQNRALAEEFLQLMSRIGRAGEARSLLDAVNRATSRLAPARTLAPSDEPEAAPERASEKSSETGQIIKTPKIAGFGKYLRE